jgi:hypothetical protein
MWLIEFDRQVHSKGETVNEQKSHRDTIFYGYFIRL